MALVPIDFFASDDVDVDFESLLQNSKPLQIEAPFAAPTFQLELRTLSGAQHCLHDLLAETTLAEVLKRVSNLVNAPPFCLKLLVDERILDCDGQTLTDAGLAKPDASVTLVRCPTNRAEWTKLFGDLICAIECRRPEEARRLVDLGAGLDGDGNILKAGHHMRLPGDRTVAEEEPGNTMLHLAIRQGLSELALYLISRHVDLNSRNDVGRTPIMMAVLKKQSLLVDTLLGAQADVSVRDYLGHKALSYALKAGNDQLSAQLVALEIAQRSDAQVPAPASTTTTTSNPQECWSACEYVGLLPTARAFSVASGAVLNGNFPVLTCCACGLPLTAVALLQNGVGTEGTDDDGRTALHYAYDLDESSYGAGRATLIETLLEKGAIATAEDNYGNLPECGIQNPQPEPEPFAAKPLQCIASFRPLWGWAF